MSAGLEMVWKNTSQINQISHHLVTGNTQNDQTHFLLNFRVSTCLRFFYSSTVAVANGICRWHKDPNWKNLELSVSVFPFAAIWGHCEKNAFTLLNPKI